MKKRLPECSCTFLGAARLLVGHQENVLRAAVTLQFVSLQQLVHLLDHTLQAFVHIQPNLVLHTTASAPQQGKNKKTLMNNEELSLSYPLLLVRVRLQGGALVFSRFAAIRSSRVPGGGCGSTRRGWG